MTLKWDSFFLFLKWRLWPYFNGLIEGSISTLTPIKLISLSNCIEQIIKIKTLQRG